MTREELREYVEKLESQGEIPYYVYSNLIDCIDTLEQEPFMNKVCVSSKACEHDKEVVLDKIRAEIEQSAFNDVNGSKFISVRRVNRIIDKYKTESEG